jgi:hypothetical protein
MAALVVDGDLVRFFEGDDDDDDVVGVVVADDATRACMRFNSADATVSVMVKQTGLAIITLYIVHNRGYTIQINLPSVYTTHHVNC